MLLGCAPLPHREPQPPAVLGLVELQAVNQRLSRELTSILGDGSPSFAAVVMLPFATFIVPEDRPDTVPDTLASHDLFLLSDGVDALSPARSVLRAYRAVIGSARCLPWASQSSVGCRLVESSKQLFDDALDEVPPYTRPGFPMWKAVTAEPQLRDWPAASWSSASLAFERYQVTMEHLFVRLQRPWLADEFLAADGWYLAGACKGAVSDGDHGNNMSPRERELLPQVPVGMLFARNFRLAATDNASQAPFLAWGAPRVLAWVYRFQPLSPLHSDPCHTGCGDHAVTVGDCSLAP